MMKAPARSALVRVGILACALAGLVLFRVCILQQPHRLFAVSSRTLSRDTHASLNACALQGWGLRQLLCACPLQASCSRQPRRAHVQVHASSTAEEAGGVGSSSPDTSPVSIIKTRMLQLSTEYGDPAVDVPDQVQRALNDLAKQLEESTGGIPEAATSNAQALDGTWRVRYSNCVPPSNGQLGPFVGLPLQVVDIAAGSYQNRLAFLNRSVQVVLSADWKVRDSEGERGGEGWRREEKETTKRTHDNVTDQTWIVTFRTLALEVLGQQVLKFNFPKATSKTWCMTYTDADTRLVRAGSDGAYSPSREMGLYAKDVGLAKDSFLFFMTKEPEA